MGVFNSYINEDQLLQARNNILNSNHVNCQIVVGTYGNDDIVAGAMMGETGKYLAMANYGNPKWGDSLIQFYQKGIIFSAVGAEFLYTDIINMEIIHEGWLHGEMIFHMSNGSFNCKMKKYDMYTTINLILEFKENYLKILAEEEKESLELKQKEKKKESIDRLIHLGEMLEKGLISEEEFASMKKTIMEGDDENMDENEKNGFENPDIDSNATINDEEENIETCENCGAQVMQDYKFCIECGNRLK